MVQVALDVVDEERALRVAGAMGEGCRQGAFPCDRLVVEAGTPLIKAVGVRVLPKLKLASGGLTLYADLKTADVGELEASLAYDFGADIASVLARAPMGTLKAFLEAGLKRGRLVAVDTIGIETREVPFLVREIIRVAREIGFPLEKLVVELHRGIDEEASRQKYFEELGVAVNQIRELSPEVKIAVAGGITPAVKSLVEKLEPDIYVVGRYITQSPNVVERIKEFL